MHGNATNQNTDNKRDVDYDKKGNSLLNNSIIKKRTKRDLEKISLFTILKKFIVEAIEDFIKEQLIGTEYSDITIDQLFHEPNKELIDNLNLNMEYAEIFNRAKNKLKVLGNALSEQSERLKNSLSKITKEKGSFDKLDEEGSRALREYSYASRASIEYSNSVTPEAFTEYFNSIENHCKKILPIIVGQNISRNYFPVIFLSWLKEIGFSDNGKIDLISTYDRVLEKYDLWNNIFKLSFYVVRYSP